MPRVRPGQVRFHRSGIIAEGAVSPGKGGGGLFFWEKMVYDAGEHREEKGGFTMASLRREDAQMKLPAALHLTRLGYGYLPGREALRDRRTNILGDSLRAAVSRINGEALREEHALELMDTLAESLNRPDLGERFYRLIRDGWQGWRLIDYGRAENNEFLVIPELSCGQGKSRFRPDLTLMVNGLPLAMIEVKTERQSKGIQAEYDRMRDRFGRPEFRPYLQAAQVLAFSNNREYDGDRLLPTEGACFATTAREDFPLRVFPESYRGAGVQLRETLPEVLEALLRDQGLEALPRNREARRSLSPQTVTHRMRTALFAPERFLLLFRYGLRYGQEGTELRKNLLSAEQFFALWQARGKLRRGFHNWRMAAHGASGEVALIASLMEMIQEEIPDSRIYWVAANRRELLQMDVRLREVGLETGRRGRREAGKPLLMEPAERPKTWLREAEERDFAGRRVFILPSPFPGSERMSRFASGLRGADPGAMIIRYTRAAEPEQGGNYTYLLECADGSLYCGWTNDLDRRISAHNEGRGAKYTRSRRPVRLVYYEEFDSKEEAMRREWRMKQLSRGQKQRLIQAWYQPAEEQEGEQES